MTEQPQHRDIMRSQTWTGIKRSKIMSRFKGILAGLGSHGRYWNTICSDHSEVELVGYVARTETSRERAAVEWGVPRERLFASLQESIERSRPDFVLDVTPPRRIERWL